MKCKLQDAYQHASEALEQINTSVMSIVISTRALLFSSNFETRAVM
jgi:hypothetical protein